MQGYYPNARKSLLIVKPEELETPKQKFKDTEVKRKDKDGRRKTVRDREHSVKARDDEWESEIRRLAEVGTDGSSL